MRTTPTLSGKNRHQAHAPSLASMIIAGLIALAIYLGTAAAYALLIVHAATGMFPLAPLLAAFLVGFALMTMLETLNSHSKTSILRHPIAWLVTNTVAYAQLAVFTLLIIHAVNGMFPLAALLPAFFVGIILCGCVMKFATPAPGSAHVAFSAARTPTSSMLTPSNFSPPRQQWALTAAAAMAASQPPALGREESPEVHLSERAHSSP